jgi:Ca-activated chloride channel family protein
MKKRLTIVSACTLFFYLSSPAQQVDQTIQKGNELYKQKQYEPAAKAYDEALAKDPSSRPARFNKANTSYRLSKPDEAVKEFSDLAFKDKAPEEKSGAYYNEGLVLSNQKKLEESIEAYKNALRQNPNDKDARENLQKALLELKKKNPPPKKEDKKKQQQQKQKQQPKMNQKEAEQKLKLLEQKEKELQQRMQKQQTKTAGGVKDW